MNTLLIVYNGLELGNLLVYLKSHYTWAKPFDNVWLIKTEKTAALIRDEVKSYLLPVDKVLVIDVSKTGWATYNFSNEVTGWMKNNI